MGKQLTADWYRQLHTRGFWAVGLVMVLAGVGITAKRLVGGITIPVPLAVRQHLYGTHWSVADGTHAGLLFLTNLVYILIALFVIAIGYEFSQRLYKNALITGISRVGFLIEKYMVLLLDLLLAIGVYDLAIVATGLLARRPLGAALLVSTVQLWLTASFFVSLIFGLGILVLIATRSLIMATVVIVVWPPAISLLQHWTQWDWLKFIDFFTTSAKISFNVIPGPQLPLYLASSLVALAATLGLATVLIRRQEL